MAGYDIWIWVAVIVVSLIIEFTTIAITSIWFAIGGLVSLIMAALLIGFELQMIVFVILSFALLVTLRRWAQNKFLNSEGTTNLDLIKKEKLELLTEITEHEKGTVKYNGIIWNAVSANAEPIKAGTWVTVEEIKGNKLIVKKEGK